MAYDYAFIDHDINGGKKIIMINIVRSGITGSVRVVRRKVWRKETELRQVWALTPFFSLKPEWRGRGTREVREAYVHIPQVKEKIKN